MKKVIFGSAAQALIYAKEYSDKVHENLTEICSHGFISDRHVCIMPDATANSDGTITGFTMLFKDAAVMGLEYGAGCGICCYDIGSSQIDFEKLDGICHEFPTQKDEIFLTAQYEFDVSRFRLPDATTRFRFLSFSLGSLGGGNHFIEIDRDLGGRNYLIVHNGVEGVSAAVLRHYLELALHKAGKSMDMPYRLEDTLLSGEDLDDYLHDMQLCIELSKKNRAFIAEQIIKEMSFTVNDKIDICHHYTDLSDNIVRHGAISAHEGEKVVIPVNSRDGTILGIGKGNPEWNFSAPHGGGRKFSRKEAKERIDFKEYQSALKEVYSTTVCKENIDEAPMAYRSIDEIAEEITDTVEIKSILVPLYNYKGY
jgi:hypothetical protein